MSTQEATPNAAGGASVLTDGLERTAPALKVKVFPYREKVVMGNIIWADRTEGNLYYRTSRLAMRGEKFPPGHPVGGGWGKAKDAQCGDGESIQRFREMGYWASCFPEGDGITWKPLNGQDDEQCMADIKDAFGWDARWGCAL